MNAKSICFGLSCRLSLVLRECERNKNFQLRNSPPEIAAKIIQVESNLLPPVLIHGEKPVPMNLAERMKHYHVPGVSIAVINDSKN